MMYALNVVINHKALLNCVYYFSAMRNNYKLACRAFSFKPSNIFLIHSQEQKLI